ncbi:EAL domain-containing protein [Aestuariicoccus sp. KMU-90]|uniref:EAL domain-containing protein n=2 Tax=Thetidibacter halocola TaxID=2827239 RepID=A0A8J7WF29_9RHOB|nr:EAL domain-containing protein [Thetidibacter halocola]
MIRGPQALAFLPAIALAAFWLGGEAVLAAVSLGLPLVYMLFARDLMVPTAASLAQAPGELTTSIGAAEMAQRALDDAAEAKLATACIMIEILGLDEVGKHHGDEAADSLRDLTLARLRNTLRRDDIAARISDSRFVIVLGPSLRLDLEALLQLSARLQTAVEEPVTIETVSRYLSANIGFCNSSRLRPGASGEKMVEAARIALAEASLHGPSAIRAWSENMHAAHDAHKMLLAEVKRALNNGQIQPWFQPQVCTSTGAISGVEALARWIHPERGLVSPAQFLRSLEEAGQMSRLGEVILQHSLTALRSWDHAGLEVPRVSVNFSSSELQDPHLVERIRWELDRFGLSACRLGVEVLETVIAKSPDGIVARNIEELGKLGCHIDLDDFGTGHSSITSLRRFPVNRIKIDRSFVTRIDRDEDQRRMMAAVLGMADRLGLGTLAEGVETVGEHALLAQLGCDHVQGFGIARPMPADQMVDWARSHAEKIADAQRLGRSAG